jgi:hypothetical protein
MVVLYEAMKDDPAIDQALVTRMQEDARLVGEMLMTPRDIESLEGPIGQGIYDLIIWDADGRPTFHHDLNPLSLEKIYLDGSSTAFNTFNLLMSLGVIKGLHHVSGDERLERFLYEEMLFRREYLDKLNREEGAIDYIYMGLNTNFDNPDMSSIALWLALYLENDPQVADELHRFLEDGWWDREGEGHSASRSKQPLWHAVYTSVTAEGVPDALVDEFADLLLGFDLGPYWNDERINCDEDELDQGECLAVDGSTVITVAGQPDDGGWMATEALHPSIRPPSNFDARSNPFRVNGGGGFRLNPGGDLLAAYWLGRYMQAESPGGTNRSPNAREHGPVAAWPADSALLRPAGGGCGCRVSSASASVGAGLAALGLLCFVMGVRRGARRRR